MKRSSSAIGAILALALVVPGTGESARPRRPSPKAAQTVQAPAAEPEPAAEPLPPPAPATPPPCPSPAAGQLPKPVRMKDNGKSTIKDSPFISTVTASTVCDRRSRLQPTVSGVLGFASYVPNTRSAHVGLIALPSIEQPLQAYLARMARVWPYAPLRQQPRILFLCSDSYAAYSLPDNTIVLSLGLLQTAESDSEILFVLAHEYSHLLLGHYFSEQRASQSRQVFGALGSLYQTGSYLSQLRMTGSGSSAQLSSTDQARVTLAIQRSSAINRAVKYAMENIFQPSWSRAEENEADVLAYDLLVAANITVDSPQDSFAHLGHSFAQQDEAEKAGAKLAQQLNDRLKDAMGVVTSPQFIQSLSAGQADTSQLKQIGGRAASQLAEGMLKALGSMFSKEGHLSADDRRKALALYVRAGYQSADTPIDTGVLIKAIKASAELQRALALRDVYVRALGSYTATDFATADTAFRSIGAGTHSAPPFVNYGAALAARDAGNTQLATAYFAAGRYGGGIPIAEFYQDYANFLIEQHDPATATAILAEAGRRFHDVDYFKPQQIRVALVGNDATGAQTLFQQCEQLTARDYLPPRCRDVMPAGTQASPAESTQPQQGKKKGLLGLIPNPLSH